jgi:hypothetical protein
MSIGLSNRRAAGGTALRAELIRLPLFAVWDAFPGFLFVGPTRYKE